MDRLRALWIWLAPMGAITIAPLMAEPPDGSLLVFLANSLLEPLEQSVPVDRDLR